MKCYTRVISGVLVFAALVLSGGAVAVDVGKQLYGTCVTCHGADGRGNKALNAPQIAGQASWYLKRQLQNFKSGIRGTHKKDIYGMQMRPMSMTLTTDEKIDQVVAYIGTLKPQAKLEITLKGDAAKGQALYGVCVTCHGPKAEGMQALNGPNLKVLQDWYAMRQIQHFKSGVRGAHKKDTYGAQMVAMAKTLRTDDDIKNVLAYISSL
ncbi:MAG: c-type cytochrome [Zetaproteobacteria bacterium]|nr:c-type cytochrome [Zetaproteobacteria bacterium]